jgi:hypothetical protein
MVLTMNIIINNSCLYKDMIALMTSSRCLEYLPYYCDFS